MRNLMMLAALALAAWPSAVRGDPDGRPDIYLRFGGALVEPITSSSELELVGVDGPASLAVENGPIDGSGATVSSAMIPAGSIGVVLPTASRRWAAELVVGAPFTVKFEATGTLSDTSIAPTALGIPTGVGPLGPRLGEAEAVPIVATAIYRLRDHGAVLPYVGGGPSLLIARKAKITNPMLLPKSRDPAMTEHKPEMKISPAPGLVVQAGVDVRLWSSSKPRWVQSVYARLDVKFILLRAHAEVHDIVVETPGLPLFERVKVGNAEMDVWVNPLIINAGVGFDFDFDLW